MILAGSLSQVLAVEDESQVGHARRAAQALAQQQGFNETDAGRVALLATELTSNLLKHAGHGELHLRVVPGQGADGIEIIAVDRGAGFDLQQCMRDGFSTRGTQGIGLGALSRLADVFDSYSDGRGSVLLAQLYPRGVRAAAWRFGVSQHAQRGEQACGDGWYLAFEAQRFSVLVVDGLGHGEPAAEAAQAGGMAFAKQPFDEPSILLERMHQAMNGTRGGAALVAQFDASSQNLLFSGVGNVAGSLIGPQSSRGLASLPGIVGARFRKAQRFDYPRGAAQVLVLFSDGLASRWTLADYPGLLNCHPAIIATLLHRDFYRGRDDVTVMVVSLEVCVD